MKDLQAAGAPDLIPILIGITGHRDLEDEAKLEKDIGSVIQDLAGRFPASPIVLLTPLAEGADRVAARAVLHLKASGMNICYVTVLPMDEDEYIQTFSDSDSVEEYYDLKGQGLGCIQVPFHESIAATDKDLRHSQLYANMGTFLALNTQVLIAAWNGAEEDAGFECAGQDCIADGARCPHFALKLGGTYHVLRVRFFGVEDDYRNDESYLSNRESGPVYWIKTKRRSSDYLAEGESVAGPAYPQFPIVNRTTAAGSYCSRLVKNRFNNLKSDNRTYTEILSKLNAYNLDAARENTPLQELIQESRVEFFTSSSGDMSEHFSVEKCSIVNHYSVADCLSSHYQRKRRKDIILLVGMAFLGLLSYSLYSGPIPWYLFIFGYSSLYLAGIMFYLFWVKEKRHHEKYVDYRGIAEAMRVQFFWDLAGVSANVTAVYLNRQKSSASWIKTAVNNAVLLAKARGEECNPKGVADSFRIIKLLWLEKQRDYYVRKQPQKQRIDTMQKRLEVFLFGIGLGTALILTGVDTYEFFVFGTLGNNTILPFGNKAAYSTIHQWVIFGVGFLPVIIASFKVFTELMAYSKLARNFKWMRLVYSIGLSEFTRIAGNHGKDANTLVRKSRRLLYDIGVEALSENGEWIGILDDRVPEMPK